MTERHGSRPAHAVVQPLLVRRVHRLGVSEPGGIAPDAERPGYRHVIVAPRPVAGIDHASASVETPFGHAAVAWQLDGGDRFTLDVQLPFGTTATLRPPVTDASR